MNNTTIINSFNPLHCANRLKAVGVPDKHAEEYAEILTETIEGNLATKTALKTELKLLEQRLVIKLGGLIAGVTVLIIGVLGLLIQLHH